MMMNKLKLEHLAPYLPYNLRFKSKYREWEITELRNAGKYKVWACAYWSGKSLTYIPDLNLRDNSVGTGFKLKDIKPILRPLSDLTLFKDDLKKINVVFMEGEWYYLDHEQEYALGSDLKSWNYNIIEKIISCHFDIFGLIDKGLAVDINTLNENND